MDLEIVALEIGINR